ncbi:2-oxoglutarate and iron-dependent oxygenase domain-containing protein [Achromobacter seleniivolatilans]|uniref:2-oxoglutarate-dependent ethylene/succinate-forming enzyme n=1 Tax=Achromobacter seleniivolatilans TaxID=3047478 RepID=A0ABY9LUK2_9BURK|nr:2-oxoglutarate and iron-dependent oxygenase domain-containing protein [Achromobacter sp. R39]WMD18320.1 2-oxoglutarate and iron-dependent oxygenase domain-containing protein [Achromobacter sp. R39]
MNENRKAVRSIPVIDVQGLRVNQGISSDLVSQVDRACREIGFFSVVNHGIDASTIDSVLAQAKIFFNQPKHLKEEIEIHKSPYMRGYFSEGADKSDGVLGDIKEGFDMASEIALEDAYVKANLPFYGPNAWPASMPHFRSVMLGYHAQALDLGRRLLRVFALGLGMPAHHFDDKFVKPMAQLRVLRYPPIEYAEGQPIGAGEHTDFGWITMIAQDSVGGLEVRNAEHEWIPVPPIKSGFVVNIGDLMSRWTNDHYPATFHRVVNTSNRERYSAAFFMDPDYYASVECLSSCVSPERPARYPPTIAGEYMDRRFLETTTFRESQNNR